MKPTRLETTLIVTAVCALTTLASPVRAASWVTVNPDGSVTHTEVQTPFEDAPQDDQSTLNGLPTSPLPRTQLPTTPAEMATYQGTRKTNRSPGVPNGVVILNNGAVHTHVAGCYHPGTYTLSCHASRPHPAYPTYPGYANAPGGYYGGTYTTTTPGPAYSIPLPGPGYLGNSTPWITNIPLGSATTTYVGNYPPRYPNYYPPAYCPPAYVPPCPPAPVCAPAYPTYGYPTYGQPTYGYPSYPSYPTYGNSSTTYGQVSIGRGGFNVTIGGSRTSVPTYSSTQTTTIFGR